MIIRQKVLHGHLCCGIGGFAKGFNKGKAKVGNYEAEFECLGGIDSDAASCRDFESQVGVKATCLDLFSREQYVDFHGHHPPPGWREATPADIPRAFRNKRPNVVCVSAPCKGFSGLLSEKMSSTKKYQALNGLTLRCIFLTLEAYKDDPVDLFVFENVPRIATRGRWLLDQINGLFNAYGYPCAETTHDCGELGNLGQSRKRFLMVARNAEKVPCFLYEPVKHPLRGVGEILDRLPVPGIVPGLGGPMHRMPALQWKTWVRLAFVRAGADWRSLNDLRVADGKLLDFGIMPERDWHGGVLGVHRWTDTAGTITAHAKATTGAFNVADPREVRGHDFHGLRVNDWEQTASAITTQRSPGSSAQSVADPRIDGHPKSVQMGVRAWSEPAGVVTGKMYVGGGPNAVADPRIEGKRYNSTFRIVQWGEASPAITGPGGAAGGAAVADPRANGQFAGKGKYRVTSFDEAAGTVIGASTTGQGAFALADPRFSNWHPGASSAKLRVTEWGEPGGTVTGAQQVASGALSVADPRTGFGPQTHHHVLKVTAWDRPGGTVTASHHPAGGALSVADPRPQALASDAREHYLTGGHYGVVPWDQPSGAVPAHAKNNNGPWSVADPRASGIPEISSHDKLVTLPVADDKLVCTIRALDGTWHRPFTTLELAALQGLVDPEEELILDGMSDSAWRERIGNMVPPPAAAAIAGVCGITLLSAWSGQTFLMGSTPIWVRNVAVGLMAATGDAG